MDFEKALDRDKRHLAKLLTVLEDRRETTLTNRTRVIKQLEKLPSHGVIGITGAPGVGKSTLVSALSGRLRKNGTVAVLAIDPSSMRSGGAILGDRARLDSVPEDKGFFFRSQANQTELGGLAPSSYLVMMALSKIFDVVLVETVGVGQSETSVARYVDHVALLVNPAGGDGLQAVKAGVMEEADSFVITKADLVDPSAAKIALAKVANGRAVFEVSARDGSGMRELTQSFSELPTAGGIDGKSHHYLALWITEQFGRRGLESFGGDRGCERICKNGLSTAITQVVEQLQTK